LLIPISAVGANGYASAFYYGRTTKVEQQMVPFIMEEQDWTEKLKDWWSLRVLLCSPKRIGASYYQSTEQVKEGSEIKLLS
jgi:hypothetical protein